MSLKPDPTTLANRPTPWELPYEASAKTAAAAVGLAPDQFVATGPVLLAINDGNVSGISESLIAVSADRTVFYITRADPRNVTAEVNESHECDERIQFHGLADVSGLTTSSLCFRPKIEGNEGNLDELLTCFEPERLEESVTASGRPAHEAMPYRITVGNRVYVDQITFPPGSTESWGQSIPRFVTYGHPALLETIAWHALKGWERPDGPRDRLMIPRIGCLDRVFGRSRETMNDGRRGEGYAYLFRDRLVFVGDGRSGTVRIPRDGATVSVVKTALHRWVPWYRSMRLLHVKRANPPADLDLDVNEKAVPRIVETLQANGWAVS